VDIHGLHCRVETAVQHGDLVDPKGQEFCIQKTGGIGGHAFANLIRFALERDSAGESEPIRISDPEAQFPGVALAPQGRSEQREEEEGTDARDFSKAAKPRLGNCRDPSWGLPET
jgi:hypothetical protein